MVSNDELGSLWYLETNRFCNQFPTAMVSGIVPSRYRRLYSKARRTAEEPQWSILVCCKNGLGIILIPLPNNAGITTDTNQRDEVVTDELRDRMQSTTTPEARPMGQYNKRGKVVGSEAGASQASEGEPSQKENTRAEINLPINRPEAQPSNISFTPNTRMQGITYK